jgi:hypothetical protein
MNSEHFYEHIMNTFMNTFLREMNTMNTSRVYMPLYCKNKNIYTVKRGVWLYSREVFILFINRFKVFMEVFINYSSNS